MKSVEGSAVLSTWGGGFVPPTSRLSVSSAQRAEVGRRLAGGEQGAPRAAVGGELRPLGAVTRDYTLTSYITQSASVRGTSPMLSVVL